MRKMIDQEVASAALTPKRSEVTRKPPRKKGGVGRKRREVRKDRGKGFRKKEITWLLERLVSTEI